MLVEINVIALKRISIHLYLYKGILQINCNIWAYQLISREKESMFSIQIASTYENFDIGNIACRVSNAPINGLWFKQSHMYVCSMDHLFCHVWGETIGGKWQMNHHERVILNICIKDHNPFDLLCCIECMLKTHISLLAKWSYFTYVEIDFNLKFEKSYSSYFATYFANY